MELVKVKKIDVWRSSAGLCLICGMPLALEPEGKTTKEEDPDLAEAFDVDEDSDLIKENFVRVSLFQYNLLGQTEKCHIIDKYTFLESYDAFKKALKANSEVVEALGGNLYRSQQYLVCCCST